MTKTKQADVIIATRLEERLLTAFWAAVQRTDDRLGVLLEYTRVVIRREEGWDGEAVRRAHTAHHGIAETIRVDRRSCFGCRVDGQLYAHHIIEIQYGGSNAVRNQVPLCFDCHQYLHPWLTEADRAETTRRGAFEAIGDIVARHAQTIVDIVDGPVEPR